MSTIHPKITEVLTHTFKVPVGEIHPGSTMDSLEMDSLAVAEFAVLIRETVEAATGNSTSSPRTPHWPTSHGSSTRRPTAGRGGWVARQ